MSQHRSLHVDSIGTKHRNVLKRYERISKLQKDEKWTEGRTVYGLPKVKSQKLKVKKVKSEEAKPAAGAEAAAAPAAPAAKPAAPPKK
jgi:small basic protein (TIGR04137 family)